MSAIAAPPVPSIPNVSPPRPVAQTVADLLARLGDVPPNRVRMVPPPGTATEQDLIDAVDRDGLVCELIDGTLVEKAMGLFQSIVASVVGGMMGEHVYANRLGVVGGEAGPHRVRPGQIRMADVSFTAWARVPADYETRFAPDVGPDLAVEVLSPSNTRPEIARKRAEYFAGGTRLVWVIDPPTRTLAAYVPGRPEPTVYRLGDVVPADDVLPGFSLDLAEVFSRATRPPGR